MVDVNRDMGERLGYLREQKFGRFHGSKVMCAQGLEISNGYWGDIERGRKKIGIDMIQRLANFFEVETEWLLSGNCHNAEFLADYYLRDYHEEGNWYEKFSLLVELAAYWRHSGDSRFYLAAAVALESRYKRKTWIQLAPLFEQDDVAALIESLTEYKVSKDSVEHIQKIINDIDTHLLQVEISEHYELPALLPITEESKKLTLKKPEMIELLQKKIIDLENTNENLQWQLEIEQDKVKTLTEKLNNYED